MVINYALTLSRIGFPAFVCIPLRVFPLPFISVCFCSLPSMWLGFSFHWTPGFEGTGDSLRLMSRVRCGSVDDGGVLLLASLLFCVSGVSFCVPAAREREFVPALRIAVLSPGPCAAAALSLSPPPVFFPSSFSLLLPPSPPRPRPPSLPARPHLLPSLRPSLPSSLQRGSKLLTEIFAAHVCGKA